MAATGFKLFVFTAPQTNLPETALLNSFLDNGAEGIYLRKPEYSASQLLHFFEGINPQWHRKVMIPLGAWPLLPAGVHPMLHVREREKNKFISQKYSRASGFTISIHHVTEWGKTSESFHYAFYSPLFESISKPGYSPSCSLPVVSMQLQKETSAIGLPQLIGLGGINEQNIRDVQQAGFDGAAVMGAIWNNKDPLESYLKVRSKIT